MTSAPQATTEKCFSSIAAHQARERPDKVAYICLGADGSELGRYTYSEVHDGVERVAAALAPLAGRAVLMLYDSGMPFILAFLACLRAGVVAVPCPYARPGRPAWDRLSHIAKDSHAAAILTETAVAGRLAGWLPTSAMLSALDLVVTDALDEAGPLPPRRADPADLAFLQYTSGSTGHPKGTMITLANLNENAKLGYVALGTDAESRVVSWLPAYHDLGLIGNILQNIFSGATCILLPPATIVKNPGLWLKAIQRYEATATVAPNFAYHLAARRIGAEQKRELDLSCWKIAGNTSEPIRVDTIRRFTEAFRDCGFRPETFRCGYGLAEATLIVASGKPRTPPRIITVNTAALEDGRLVPDEIGREIVASGNPHWPQTITIVDPERRVAVDDGVVGEIWVSGPCVAAGYLCGGEISAQTFEARLADGSGPFLRTGDLGALLDGDIFVVGRSKEVIILRGRKIFPQDVESVVQDAHPALKSLGSAAFGVAGRDGECVVVVQEIERTWLQRLDAQEVASEIRNAVFEAFEIGVADVVLVKPDTVPKTSSGKVQRVLCRQLYLSRELETLTPRPAPRMASAGR